MSMLDIFRSIRNIVKISQVSIDSTVFRLHYSITVLILLLFSFIVTTRQYVGNPIDCIRNRDIPEEIINQYCWIHSTYTIPDAFGKKIGEQVPHPGVDRSTNYEGERRYAKYYQWVYVCLFFQAICFYSPRWMWKNWEGGKIHALMMDLDVGICSEVEKKQKKKLLLDYLADNLKHHNWWAYRYFFCETLAFLNVVGQMFLIDRFLGGTFLTFGLDVIQFMEDDQETRIDPMIFVFPRMTKCSFSKFGASGELERYDSLCILPINIVNEKIYIFLWFWFLLLTFLTFLVLLYRLMIILSPRMRAYLLCLRFRLINKEVINTIVRKSKMGDWFLFFMLGQNVDTLIFKEVMHELAKRLGHASKDFGEA